MHAMRLIRAAAGPCRYRRFTRSEYRRRVKAGDELSALQARRVLLLALLDVAVAAVAAVLVFRTFGVARSPAW